MSFSPWAKVNNVEPVNLQEIMSEEVARLLQTKEDKLYMESSHSKKGATVLQDSVKLNENNSETTDCCSSDLVIALMLQQQFDKEHDNLLKKTEDKFNGDSKVSVSYSNYRRSTISDDSESDDELVDIIDRKDWDRFDNVERSLSAIPRCGYVKQDGALLTKHDMTLSGRKNACKFMSFPPEFQTGDGAGFDLQLSNKVFNSLKVHSHNEHARRHKMHDRKEDLATAEFGIDGYTKLLLYKFVNNNLLERVNGIISTGKEAVILHADTNPAYTECVLPKESVVKVFKTTLSDFKHRDIYIKHDYRFKDRFGKPNSKKMVQMWAEKEMHNLRRLQKADIACPEVIALKKHILIMSFIGENHSPAPKLKHALLDNAEMVIAYEQVIETMKKFYTQANLIHADLSEYNILWYNDKCWFIDVGQSVEPTHPNAHQFLFRDCTNIYTFFNRKGVAEVKDPCTLFKEITGFEYFNADSSGADSSVESSSLDISAVDFQSKLSYQKRKM